MDIESFASRRLLSAHMTRMYWPWSSQNPLRDFGPIEQQMPPKIVDGDRVRAAAPALLSHPLHSLVETLRQFFDGDKILWWNLYGRC